MLSHQQIANSDCPNLLGNRKLYEIISVERRIERLVHISRIFAIKYLIDKLFS